MLIFIRLCDFLNSDAFRVRALPFFVYVAPNFAFKLTALYFLLSFRPSGQIKMAALYSTFQFSRLELFIRAITKWLIYSFNYGPKANRVYERKQIL